MMNVAVCLVQSDPSDASRSDALDRRIRALGMDCAIRKSQPGENDFLTLIDALAAHHARHASRQWPLIYLTDHVDTHRLDVLPALVSEITTLQPHFTVCFLHRWNDRCDFLTESTPLRCLQPSVTDLARTRFAHGTEALLFSWSGLCRILNDEVVRKAVKNMKIETRLPNADPSLPHDSSNASWSQWTSLPDRRDLVDAIGHTAPRVNAARFDAGCTTALDTYLTQLLKNTRDVIALCVTPCLFQWLSTTTPHFEDYERTHECRHVQVETTLPEKVKQQASTIPRAFEWILIALLLFIGIVFFYMTVYKRKRERDEK